MGRVGWAIPFRLGDTSLVKEADVVLWGDGDLSGTAVQRFVSTPSLAGSGGLSATVVKVAFISAPLGGSGEITVTQFPVYSRSASLEGSGVLSAAWFLRCPVTSSSSGEGTLSATAIGSGQADLSGEGILDAAIFPLHEVEIFQESEGVLEALVSGRVLTDRIEIGDDILTPLDFYVGDQRVHAVYAGDLLVWWHIENVEAELSGIGSLNSLVLIFYEQLVDLSGDGTISATTSQVFAFTPPFSGVGTASATAFASYSSPVSLSGSGSLTATAVKAGPLSLLTGVTPAVASESDGASVNLGMRFTSSIDTYVTGVRFHKGATSNGGTHIGALWSNAGANLATVTFTEETAFGWQEMLFETPVAITAGTTYVVSYLAPQGCYSATSHFFDTAYTNGTLTGPAWSAPTPNGVYAYAGVLAFPDQSFNATSYFVDVVTQTVPTQPTPPWVNHVSIAAPRNGTNTHTVNPASGSVVSGANFTPTAGSLLVCVAAGPVTSTTPSGWILPTNGSAISSQGHYVWHRTAAGGDTFTTTHNGSNFPVLFDFYEFPAGSSFVKCASDVNVDRSLPNPGLTGLTGTNQIFFTATRGADSVVGSYLWSGGSEIVDTGLTNSPNDAYNYTLAYRKDVATASVTGLTPDCTLGGVHERLTFAVKVP